MNLQPFIPPPPSNAKKLLRPAIDGTRTFLYSLLKKSPSFLIIGAEKCGTTSLHNHLSLHPDILAHETKELHFFDTDQRFDRGRGYYLKDFPWKATTGNKLTFESTPNYLFDPRCANRIKDLLGKLKLIILLREPANRAFSAWNMYHSFQNSSLESLRAIGDVRDFAKAIQEELDNPNLTKSYPYCYVRRGEYESQIRRYFELFGRERCLIIESSLLKNKTDDSIKKICNFLEITPVFKVTNELPSKKTNTGSYQMSMKQEAVIAQLKEHYRPHNESLFSLLDERYNW